MEMKEGGMQEEEQGIGEAILISQDCSLGLCRAMEHCRLCTEKQSAVASQPIKWKGGEGLGLGAGLESFPWQLETARTGLHHLVLEEGRGPH